MAKVFENGVRGVREKNEKLFSNNYIALLKIGSCSFFLSTEKLVRRLPSSYIYSTCLIQEFKRNYLVCVCVRVLILHFCRKASNQIQFGVHKIVTLRACRCCRKNLWEISVLFDSLASRFIDGVR